MSRFAMLALAPAAIVASVAATAPAQAAEFRDYDAAAFAKAQAEGRSIIIDIHAWWCPVCASQAATIKSTTAASYYKDLIIFRVDYDKQKDVWQSFGAHKQATLIGYHGKKEVGRIEFMTDKTKINALLAATKRG